MLLMNQQEFRASILASYGASAAETAELLAYNHNVFDHSHLTFPLGVPLGAEPHVATWEAYVAAARAVGAFEVLKQALVQLRFPIRAGISQTEAYCSATRKGVLADGVPEATGLVLRQPKMLQVIVHQSLAGAIPVLITRDREDFVTLVQALTMRNEPGLVPASMGACMVAGFNNWDRVHQYRRHWEAQNPSTYSEAGWTEEFRRLISRKELYQDRFIILSDGPYSDVSAGAIGLSEREWRRLSLTIRLEHECTHYFTCRLFNSMRNNLLDELIADYRGIVNAIGHYRADWFLRFLGLESPSYREGGRLQLYRGQPPLSQGAFKILQALVKAAAENLERFDADNSSKVRTPQGQSLLLVGLTHLTLEELASQAAPRPQKLLDELWTTLLKS